MKTVVAALIEKDGKYLVAKRSTGNPKMIGKWEFPGGKVEPGETEENALIRELTEELNVFTEVEELLDATQMDEGHVLKLYKCKCELNEYRLSAHSEIEWLDIVEILKRDIPPADRILCKKHMETGRYE